jgi:hypothetical protein
MAYDLLMALWPVAWLSTRIYTQGSRGRQNKSVTPVVGGWVRGQKRTRVRFVFLIFFYDVFELPSPRIRPKT